MNCAQHNIVFFDQGSPTSPSLKVLAERDIRAVRVTKPVEIFKRLQELSPKVFFICAENLELVLDVFYKSYFAARNFEICNYKLVAIIPRKFEEEANKACVAGIIDDYVIDRPLYEKFRIINICRHLLLEIGIKPNNSLLSTAGFEDAVNGFGIKTQSAVLESLRTKNERAKELENAIAIMEEELSLKLSHDKQALQFDRASFSKLQTLLSCIQFDDVKPELINLQHKALAILEKALNITNSEDAAVKTGEELGAKSLSIEQRHTRVFNQLFNNTIDPDEIIERCRSKRSVLLVEDDLISVELTTRLLKKNNLNVEVATSGKKAFSLMREKEFDLILMDISLPDSNGLFIVDKVTSTQGPNMNTAIIMLSGNRQKNVVQKAIENGAKDYLLKPLRAKSLSMVLEKYMSVNNSKVSPV